MSDAALAAYDRHEAGAEADLQVCAQAATALPATA